MSTFWQRHFLALNVCVGIDVAYRCGKTLHGDISARNIMIRDLSLPARPGRPVISSVGILNDWDHGIPTDSRPGPHEHRTVRPQL